ncbi:hypothetical protein, partial [Consotaella aegiceratis]|uniref:hypothetical protein n=1 Tax=Consotaella aegiceratis TaxID=3097961 RepID=UPI002F42B601
PAEYLSLISNAIRISLVASSTKESRSPKPRKSRQSQIIRSAVLAAAHPEHDHRHVGVAAAA